ncbi:hypothetical protein IFO70_09715 [Phormidium tenue FACHB-886]|nr:hypothetical protein [Phormidium tenue FACHB-886]
MANLKRTKTPADIWLLYTGFVVALVSLVLIDHSNNSKSSLLAQLRQLTQPQPITEVEGAFNQTTTLATSIAGSQAEQQPIAPPAGWQAVTLASGATVYQAPEAITAQVGSTPESENRSAFYIDPLDGTREPYLTEVQAANLLKRQIAPQRYVWQGIWQGEGYTRELDYEGWLIARQEGGNNVYLSATYDAAITDPSKPNLFITIESSQDKTAQLTNLSAFLYDSNTGKLIERRDFEQLAPFYDVSATLGGKTEVKQLRPLGTITFSYHVDRDELNDRFPLTLEAVNQLVDERNQQIAALEAKGWVVKEVPAPAEQ